MAELGRSVTLRLYPGVALQQPLSPVAGIAVQVHHRHNVDEIWFVLVDDPVGKATEEGGGSDG
jgi:hypothetical protein